MRRPLSIELSPQEYSDVTKAAGRLANAELEYRFEGRKGLNAQAQKFPAYAREDIEETFARHKSDVLRLYIEAWKNSGRITKRAARQLQAELEELEGSQ